MASWEQRISDIFFHWNFRWVSRITNESIRGVKDMRGVRAVCISSKRLRIGVLGVDEAGILMTNSSSRCRV